MGACRGSGQARGRYYASPNDDGDTVALEEDEIKPRLVPILLDRMGIAELERYIAELQSEIARAEQHIAAKRDHRSAADTLFKF